jgi:hypothetical protein
MWELWFTNWHWGMFSLSTSVSLTNSHFNNYATFSNHPIIRRYIVSTQTASIKTNLNSIKNKVFTICSFTFYTERSAVGIATGYGLDYREVGVLVPVGSRIFTSLYRLERLWGPPSLLFNGYWGSFPGVKRPRREPDHSPPASAEIKKTWIYTSTPPQVFKN